MSAREALWLAAGDLYLNSWRFALLNSAVGLSLVLCVLAAVAFPAAAILFVAAGPPAAALAHCAVTLVRTGDVRIADAWHGLRLYWRRGLGLGAVGFALTALGAFALHFYGDAGLWPLTFLSLYLLVLLGIYELVLWIVAVSEPRLSLRAAAREAGTLVGSRPGAALLLGLALLLVNVLGLAAAVMPFLTLTLAYTFLAAARFVLPRPSPKEAP